MIEMKMIIIILSNDCVDNDNDDLQNHLYCNNHKYQKKEYDIAGNIISIIASCKLTHDDLMGRKMRDDYLGHKFFKKDSLSRFFFCFCHLFCRFYSVIVP